jgi:hypothetical protein
MQKYLHGWVKIVICNGREQNIQNWVFYTSRLMEKVKLAAKLLKTMGIRK